MGARPPGPAKRLIDLLISSLALIVAAPVMAVVAALILGTMGRPILFTQRRPGYRGKLFTVYKFRTMRDSAEGDGRPRPDAERLTRLGRGLRATSLDELPELFNVLRGDMSLVGPRPLLPEYLDRYTPAQARRHDVRPGLTGLAQVRGRNALTWDEKFDLDLFYVENRTMLLDLRILARTVVGWLRPSGISHGEHATMPEFRGSSSAGER
jgi:lipopolysaccharide/colanic/teichoic acid biosynthesis glycosyltransferase